MSKQRDFKGIWIPKEIWLSEDLKMQEKLFLVEIDSLDNEDGCYASNKYFSEFFGLSKGRCSQIINALINKGFMNVNYIREDSGRVTKRVLSITNKVFNILNRGSKYPKGGIKNTKGGYLEYAKENNTSNNNTSNNKENVGTSGTDYPKSVKYIDEAEQVADYLLDSICEYDPTHKYNTNEPARKSWVLDIERAMRLDGRTQKELFFIIDYIFRHNGKHSAFWAGNIESGAKLRKQFDKIKNQIKTEKNYERSRKKQDIKQYVDTLYE